MADIKHFLLTLPYQEGESPLTLQHSSGNASRSEEISGFCQDFSE